MAKRTSDRELEDCRAAWLASVEGRIEALRKYIRRAEGSGDASKAKMFIDLLTEACRDRDSLAPRLDS